jgi:hypothetical protein
MTERVQARAQALNDEGVWRVADFAPLPDDGQRCEIINSALFAPKRPHWHHEQTAGLTDRLFLRIKT